MRTFYGIVGFVVTFAVVSVVVSAVRVLIGKLRRSSAAGVAAVDNAAGGGGVESVFDGSDGVGR